MSRYQCIPKVIAFCVPTLFAATLHVEAQGPEGVFVWEETVSIPTYAPGPPDPNPMFYFGRASQGAEGRIYPYPLYDNLTDHKEDVDWRIVYLENEYVKIGIMPEIGGRIFSGLDKTNGYNFFYRQSVIKPALIGLIGAWISGGVEWNIPHHHRATTYLPVQYDIHENPDGSKTVWVGELEIRHRMRWAVGYTLRPGKSYLETAIRIVNRTPVSHTMLAFANAAVHTNEDYQIIFPPSTQYVTHHHKREFTTWPIATTRYGGSDFSDGVDVSWYSNHHNANSMFAWNYEDDFFAGYDHGREAGTMSVADHHTVPGKKFWTWGSGPRGRMWDEILTDEDGPYIELMAGAYSDNQPDYSWLLPFDSRVVSMYWYPFRGIGGVKEANLDAAVNLEVTDDSQVVVGFYTTAAFGMALVNVSAGDRVLLSEVISIDPGSPFVTTLEMPAGVEPYELRAALAVDGEELVAYSPERPTPSTMPEAVEPPPPPAEIQSVEELYLTGLRIQQFHNPALEPEPYWEEALSRDPGHSAANTGLGVLAFERARYDDAERFLRAAVERVTASYTTPKDAEPLYYLGIVHKARGNMDEAVDVLSRATWNAEWKGPAHYTLAELSSLHGDLKLSLHHVDRAIEASSLNLRALTLKAALLRHHGDTEAAQGVIDKARASTDPLDVRILAETWLLTGNPEVGASLDSTLRNHPATGLETAVEFMNAGLWSDAAAMLDRQISAATDRSSVSPMVYYYRGFVANALGSPEEALEYYRIAQAQPPDYVFPFQREAVEVLHHAIEFDQQDARARYFLGNLLFDWQPEEAVALWKESAALDPTFPIVFRNLALAWSHRGGEESLDSAISAMETAVSLSDQYPIHFFELDRLYEASGSTPEQRLEVLERNESSIVLRDDATARAINLKIVMGKADEAIQLLAGRVFDIWEGGARFNPGDAWTNAHLVRGRQRLQSGVFDDALANFEAAVDYPSNLRAFESGGLAPHQAEVSYWTGVAHEANGDSQRSHEIFQQVAGLELRRPTGSRSISVNQGIQLYFQATSLQKLGSEEEAEILFREIRRAGETMLADLPAGVGYFSSFGEAQSERSRLASAHYLKGLGHLGLGQGEMARLQFETALEARPDHLGARMQLEETSRQ